MSTGARVRLRRLLQDLLSPGILPVLVLTGCLGVTTLLWRGAVADAEQDVQADFESRVRELVNSLDQRMQTYVQVLYGVQGLFASSQLVDREEFRTYLTGQDLNRHFPGVHGVGYIQLVDAGQRAAHEASVRRDGYPDYRIAPEGQRAWYAPIVYLEPFNDNNRRAFGYDTASETHRRTALEQARDAGQPAMSAKIRLVQEAGEPVQAGFLVVLPVYRHAQPLVTLAQRRAAISGWVYAPFRTGDLMAGLGGPRAAALDVEIYDGDAVEQDALMYDSAPHASEDLRSMRQQISIANHRWTLRISMLPGVVSARNDKAQQIAASGVALGVLLAWLTWLLARGRVQARQGLLRSRALAAELKEGQHTLMVLADSAQRSQAMLRSILDSTVDGILVDNLHGAVLNSNRRFRELWNVPEHFDWQNDGAVLMRHMCAQLNHPDCGPQLDGDVREESSEVLHLKDGRVIEKHTRGLMLGSEAARIWSFRDITERTHIEQREQTRRHVLELLATGAPLQTILESVVLGVEAANEDMLCSILLLDESGEHLLVGAAPSLPAFFNAALHGKPLSAGLGACGQTVLTRSRVIVEDIRSAPAWAEYRDLALQARLGSCWSDPIISTSGAVLGTFAIYHREARMPSLANIALIEQGARLAGIAIEQAQAALALRAGEARFRSLYDHAPVALWEQDWSAVRNALAELDGIDNLDAYLLANPSQLRRLASLVRIVDVNAAALQQVAAPQGRKDVGGLTLAQNFDAAAMPNFARAVSALAQGQHFFACEGSFERLDGVERLNELTLLVMPGHTHSLDFVIVSTLDITERRRMDDELRVLATTDFLTGLPNRREFMGRLEQEQGRLQRGIGADAGAAVLLLDIDHFKRINDEHGHAAGDAVLRQLAQLMRDSQRKIDMLGRIGGEEFAILLPGTELDAAAVFAERLRQRVAQTPMRLDDAVALHITVSIGVAVMDGKQAGGDQALSRADQALYCAKRGGRNRVELMDVEADRPGHQVPAASG